MAFIDDDRIDRIVAGVREEFGINHQLIPDMRTCIYKARAAGVIKGYRCVPSAQMSEFADFDPDTGILSIREDVWQASYYGMAHARFTIAHELGHAVLKHPKKRFRAALKQDRVDAPKVIKVDEAQADAFAAAFLIPPHLVEASSSMRARELAGMFGVSLKCAEIRLPQLQRLYRIKNGIKRDLPQNVIDFLESFNSQPRRR